MHAWVCFKDNTIVFPLNIGDYAVENGGKQFFIDNFLYIMQR